MAASGTTRQRNCGAAAHRFGASCGPIGGAHIEAPRRRSGAAVDRRSHAILEYVRNCRASATRAAASAGDALNFRRLRIGEMGSTLSHHFATMAYNNAWANHRLLTACCKLSHADFEAPRTSFFPSLKATLNHIVTVDWYYIDALERALHHHE